MLAVMHLLAVTSAADGPSSFAAPPEIAAHGVSSTNSVKSTFNGVKATATKIPPECDFSSASAGVDYQYVALSDSTCFGWSHAADCKKPWSLCDTAQGMHCMYQQLRAHPSATTIVGKWKGSFQDQSSGFIDQDAYTFEEAIVLANGHNQRMAFSTESFNAFEWEKAAGATAYFWGSKEGIASVKRVGDNSKDLCTPVNDDECRVSANEL